MDAYMRWALMAAEEVVGKQGLDIILRENHLERFIDNYPAEKMEIGGEIKTQDYTNLGTGVLEYYERAGKSMDYRVGRITGRYAIRNLGALFNVAARAAIRALPLDKQIAVGLDAAIVGLQKGWLDYGEKSIMRKEDTGEKFALIFGTCSCCVGKIASQPMCHQTTGLLLEDLEWLTGKKIAVEEVECRAMGAEACVWEINKRADE